MRSVVTIGVFDGVHRGHQELVSQAVASAKDPGVRCVVVTFDPNPAEVVRPDAAPTRLCSVPRRVEMLYGLGVDRVEVLAFDERMAAMTAQEFIDEILRDRFDAAQVVVGDGFRFGNRAKGTVQTLRDSGLHVEEVVLLGNGEPMSSTRVRAAVAAGDMSLAEQMLGRPHELEGVVGHGEGRGRDLGFPTANVDHDPRAAVPADGVYAGHAVVEGVLHPTAISIGTNPTFEGRQRTVEAYLLDFDDDLYSQPIRLQFAQRLRPTLAFESVDALIQQMHADVAATRAMLA